MDVERRESWKGLGLIFDTAKDVAHQLYQRRMDIFWPESQLRVTGQQNQYAECQ